jgi:hypothetical protein
MHTGVNKNDIHMGVASLGADFEWGNIRLPFATSAAKARTRLLADEAITYPGARTDIIMALWFLKMKYRGLSKRRLYPTMYGPQTSGGWQLPRHLVGVKW